MAGPAFGSPAWRALYAKKPAGGGEAAPTRKTPAQKAAAFVSSRRPGASKQPNLNGVINGLEAAIKSEPEIEDRQQLVSALATIKKVNEKNATE